MGVGPHRRSSKEDAEMAELNQQQVVDYIKGISVLELSQLVKALETELGVSAAAAMPVAMPGGGGGRGGRRCRWRCGAGGGRRLGAPRLRRKRRPSSPRR